VNSHAQPAPAVVSLADDDGSLARRIAAGDRTAFELLLRRHNRRLYRLARATLRDDAEAEDALQEAYLSAYRSILLARQAHHIHQPGFLSAHFTNVCLKLGIEMWKVELLALSACCSKKNLVGPEGFEPSTNGLRVRAMWRVLARV